MKKLALFTHLFTFLFLFSSSVYSMDIPNNINAQLYTLVMNFLQQNASNDLTTIRNFIRNNQINLNKVDPSVVYAAINYGNLPLVQLLVQEGADILGMLPNGNTPFTTAYSKAKLQKNENDEMQIALGYQRPEYKRVFLFLIEYLLDNQTILHKAIEARIITRTTLGFALELAQQYNRPDLIQQLKPLIHQ